MSEGRDVKPLNSVNAVRAYQREWLDKIRKRVKQGEPFVICHADECEEILNNMDIPVMVVNYWNALIATKGMTEYYNNVLAQRGYDTSPTGILLISAGLASTMDNKPEIAPLGGLPKPTVIIGSRSDVDWKILELWAREFGCLFYPLELRDTTFEHQIPPHWWEKVKDHWDEMIDPYQLDFKVERLKELISFLEIITGRTLSITKLKQSMELINEQMRYYGMARDLVTGTVPCPVNVRDHLTMHQTLWHRGTILGRDLVKAYYEEVKERVEKGIAAYPNEKLRLMWEDGTPPKWGPYVAEKYGAICIAPLYASIGHDGYTRTVLNNDPLRTLASRHFILIHSTPEWRLRDAMMCKCDGVIKVNNSPLTGQSQFNSYFEAAGIPMLEIPRDSDDAEIKTMLDDFIKKRLLSKL